MQVRKNSAKDLRWLAFLLAFGLIAALIAHARLPFTLELTEYGLPSLEFARTHRISSAFLSIGYSALVGCALSIFPGISGLAVANITIYLAWVSVVWVVLRQLGATARAAFVIGLAFVLYPDILLSVNKVYQTNMTSLCLLACLSAVLYLVRSRTSYRADVLLAIVVGVAVLCRSNLFVVLPLTWFFLWKYKLPNALLRATGQTLGAALIYVAVTIAVHGSVFWPQVGSYVLFSGANEYTEQDMLTSYDNAAEGSLIPALKLRGIDAYHDWGRPDNIPGDNEIRNPRFAHLYNVEALKFAKGHPLTMVKLTGLKLAIFLRPDLQIHPANTVGGLLKVLETCALPLWIFLCFFTSNAKGDPSRLIVALLIAVYTLPHLLSVTAPRFRTPVDVVCLVASAGMLLVWRQQRQASEAAR